MHRADGVRVALAIAVTLGALPVLWLVSRDDGTNAPNVAAVDVRAAGASTTSTSTTAPDVMGTVAPRFLTAANDGGSSRTSAPVVVGGQDAGALIGAGTATYRRDVARPGLCLSDGVEAGLEVTVTNIDNGRSIACTTQARDEEAAQVDELVLLTTDFAQLADLTDAPISIEIRQ